MNPTPNVRHLRYDQTRKEKQLWRALRAGRFAGFKFRRRHLPSSSRRVPGERLNWQHYVGGAFIVTGAMILAWR